MPAHDRRPAGIAALGDHRSGRRSLHAAGQLVVGGLLSFFIRTRYEVRVTSCAPRILAPRQILVFNHARDLDIPLLVSALLSPRTWRTWPGRLVFAGSSELVRPGFLSLYFPQLGPLRHWLAPLDLGPILRALRVVPVSTPGPRLVAAWLADLCACFDTTARLGDLLSPAWMERAVQAGIPSTSTLGEVAALPYHPWLAQDAGPELVRPEVFRRLCIAAARRAPEQLAALAGALNAGEVVVLAPEGNLSPDGRIQPFRSGLHRLLRAVPQATVLPVGLTYDLLLPGRPRAYVRIGRPLAGLAELSRGACDRHVRAHLARLRTVTLAQLVGWYVLEELPPDRQDTSVAELAAWLPKRAQDYARLGYAVDRRVLDPKVGRVLLARLLHHATAHGLVVDGGRLRLDRAVLKGLDASWRQNPLAYARNELADLLSAQKSDTAGSRAR